MTRMVALLAGASIAVACASCGKAATGATTKTGPVSRAPAAKTIAKDVDGDRDSHTHTPYDADDITILEFGRPAEPAQERAVAAVVGRYYAAVQTADGAAACPLVYSLTAEHIAEQQGRVLGPSGLPPRVCAAVMSRVLERVRGAGALEAAGVSVFGVRVEGPHALALLRRDAGPARYITLKREGRVWKIKELLDRGMH